jgi:hypothetical protein
MFKLVWIDAPGWLVAAMYVAIGWIAIVALPGLLDWLGIVAAVALGLGGVLYSTGAVIHARKRPDPVPTVFGYHVAVSRIGDPRRRAAIRGRGSLGAVAARLGSASTSSSRPVTLRASVSVQLHPASSLGLRL